MQVLRGGDLGKQEEEEEAEARLVPLRFWLGRASGRAAAASGAAARGAPLPPRLSSPARPARRHRWLVQTRRAFRLARRASLDAEPMAARKVGFVVRTGRL